MLKVKKMLN